jgi:GTPase Era involved in 16S rRNA processing
MARQVVLIGKVGHGKTYLMNKLCGTTLLPQASQRGCPLVLHTGQTNKQSIVVTEAPGMYGSQDMQAHIQALKAALTNTPLSGIYAVVKAATRTADMTATINRVMDVVGDDDIRIIVTHIDTLGDHCRYDDMINGLSCQLEVSRDNIFLVGKDTDADKIESFIHATLHEPKQVAMHGQQAAAASSLCVGERQFSKRIKGLSTRIDRTRTVIKMLEQRFGTAPEGCLAMLAVEESTKQQVGEDIHRIRMEAKELPPAAEHVVGQRLEVVSKKLQPFFEAPPGN